MPSRQPTIRDPERSCNAVLAVFSVDTGLPDTPILGVHIVVARYIRTGPVTVHERRCLRYGVFRAQPVRAIVVRQPTITNPLRSIIWSAAVSYEMNINWGARIRQPVTSAGRRALGPGVRCRSQCTWRWRGLWHGAGWGWWLPLHAVGCPAWRQCRCPSRLDHW